MMRQRFWRLLALGVMAAVVLGAVAPAQAGTAPTAVRKLHIVRQAPASVTVAWRAPEQKRVKSYTVSSMRGGGLGVAVSVGGKARRATLTGLPVGAWKVKVQPRYRGGQWGKARTVAVTVFGPSVEFTAASGTGGYGQFRVQFAVGASYGATSRVECTVDGVVCPGSPWAYPAGGASDTRTFQYQRLETLGDVPVKIFLRPCNEVVCGAGQTREATSYGAEGAPVITAVGNGPNVDLQASWTTAGQPAHITISRNGTVIWSTATSDDGVRAQSDVIGYGNSAAYVLTVSRPSGTTYARAIGVAFPFPPPPPPPF